MKRFKEFLIYICSFIITVTCLTKLTFPKVQDPSINELLNSVYPALDMKVEKKASSGKLQKIYNISPNDVESFVLYMPQSNMDVDELLILRENDNSKTEELVNKIKDHLKQQQDTFRDYAPKQYQILKNGKIDQIGKYIIFVVGSNEKKIVDAYSKKF